MFSLTLRMQKKVYDAYFLLNALDVIQYAYLVLALVRQLNAQSEIYILMFAIRKITTKRKKKANKFCALIISVFDLR